MQNSASQTIGRRLSLVSDEFGGPNRDDACVKAAEFLGQSRLGMLAFLGDRSRRVGLC
jgi:hypothetical protein